MWSQVSISDNDLSSAMEVLQSNMGEVEAVSDETLEDVEDGKSICCIS